LFVIPDLIRNPVFSTGFPLEFTPHLSDPLQRRKASLS
jgi:hypothetical protein